MCALREILYYDKCLYTAVLLHNYYDVCAEENGTHVIGIVFDASSRTLFWTDALQEIIAKMHVPVNGEPGDPVVLHNLTGRNPRGIALDVCNRCAIYDFLLATSRGEKEGEIERGSGRRERNSSSRLLFVYTVLKKKLNY